jgi:hypothetical protein
MQAEALRPGTHARDGLAFSAHDNLHRQLRFTRLGAMPNPALVYGSVPTTLQAISKNRWNPLSSSSEDTANPASQPHVRLKKFADIPFRHSLEMFVCVVHFGILSC